jgi:diguanylate cyclase (GGDEF)-like protein
MVISSFFNDRKTIFVIYATSIAVWITSAFMYNYGVTSAGKALDVRDFAATFLLISCVLAISVILYNFNKLQVEDVVEYYDGEKKLQEKLSTDYLTQLHTRFSIYENIKQAMHDYYFSGKDVCVAMLDIDFFKKVNDTYGHDKGDMVLRTLSRVISQYTDDTIHAGRYGGEEFLILFSGYTRKQAGKILEGMLTNFRNQEYDFLPEDVIITFSAGFTYLDNKNIDVEGFIKCADEALYYSKEHGRNQITYYNDLRLRDMQVNR